MTTINKHICSLIICIYYSSIAAQTNPTPISQSAFSPKMLLTKGSLIHFDSTTFILTKDTPITGLTRDYDSLQITGILIPNPETSKQGQEPHKAYIPLNEGRKVHIKYSDWDTEPLIIPIKIRPAINQSPLEFVGEFTLGSYIGYQSGRSTISLNRQDGYSQTIALFAAPSMIKINPEVADTDSSNIHLGFSFGGGWIFKMNNYQIGLVAGLDYTSGDISRSWIYQGKPWYSVTIGFDFNDEEKH